LPATQVLVWFYNLRIVVQMELWMTLNLILFLGLALVSIASATGLLLSRSAIYAALNLILNFTAIALFYLMLHAPFIALTQITVYAGAIMVLFLFVIMLLGAERLSEGPTLVWQRPLSIFLACILVAEAVYLVFFRMEAAALTSTLPPGYGTPFAIGETLFAQYLLPFEAISLLLLTAMVGAIVLTRKSEKKA
jgi:NADH-quinone oxidoreductase subunit J